MQMTHYIFFWSLLLFYFSHKTSDQHDEPGVCYGTKHHSSDDEITGWGYPSGEDYWAQWGNA